MKNYKDIKRHFNINFPSKKIKSSKTNPKESIFARNSISSKMHTLNSSLSSSKKEKPKKSTKVVSITMKDVHKMISSTSIINACAKIFDCFGENNKKKIFSSKKKKFKKKSEKYKNKNNLKGNIIDINLYRSLNYKKVKSVTFEPDSKPKLLLTIGGINKIIMLTYSRELKCYQFDKDSIELLTYMVLNDSPLVISHKTNFLFLLYDSIQCGYIEIRDINTFAKRLTFFPKTQNLPLNISLTTKIDDFIYFFDSQNKFYKYDWIQSSELKNYTFPCPIIFSQISDTHIYLYLKNHTLMTKELLNAEHDFKLYSDFGNIFNLDHGTVKYFYRMKGWSMVGFLNCVSVVTDVDRAVMSFDLRVVDFCVCDRFIVFAEKNKIVYVDVGSWEIAPDEIVDYDNITHVDILESNLVICHGQFQLSHVPISN